MVKTSLVTLVALAATASAHPPPPPDDEYEPPPPEPTIAADDSPSFNMFGVDFQIGALPANGTDTLAMAIGLDIEHPVFRVTRVAAEYDWLWLLHAPTRTNTMPGMLPRPDDHGTGHRVALALRRELKAKSSYSSRVFIDGELGATVALVNDNMSGVSVLPGVFTGVRFGYDLYTGRDASPSHTFETALLVRLTAMQDGLGVGFGLAMLWGN